MTCKSAICLATLALLLPASLNASKPSKGQQQSTNAPSASSQNNAQPDPAERIFEANCSRCHMAPSSLSQRTTGTVVMHMRMRARLSQRDEQLLLRYLAP
ncbi:MAG: cytochrome c [Acidobacteria bacterium]|nr:cytochrome c [Acidobacteriota bacterium]